MSIDNFVHVAELVPLIGLGWKMLRVLTRLEDNLKNFPLHRHLNGKIIYPSGEEPPRVEVLSGGNSVSGKG